MKLKPLLHALMLAMLVILAGCGLHRPVAVPTSHTPDPTPAQTRQAPPAIPAPPMQEISRNKVPNEAPAPSVRRPMPPPSPAKQSPMMMPPIQLTQPMPGDINTENYTRRDTHPIQLVSEQPVSTFSIDVDTARTTYGAC